MGQLGKRRAGSPCAHLRGGGAAPFDGHLFTLEHEVRSMRHALYARPLVNRNPARSNRSYAPGYEEQSWSLPAPSSS